MTAFARVLAICALLAGMFPRGASALTVETVITTEAVTALLPPAYTEPGLSRMAMDPAGYVVFINSDGPYEDAFDYFMVLRASLTGSIPATPEVILDRGQLDAFYGSASLTSNLRSEGIAVDEAGRVFLSLRRLGSPTRLDIIRITPGVSTSTLEFLVREHPDFPTYSDGVTALAVTSPTLYATRNGSEVVLAKNQQQDSVTSFSSVAPAFNFITDPNVGSMLVNEATLLGASAFNTSASECRPADITFDAAGDLLVLDVYDTADPDDIPNGIVKVDLPSGSVSLVKSGASIASDLGFGNMRVVGMAVDPATGDIYLARRRDTNEGQSVIFFRLPGGNGTAQALATYTQVRDAGGLPSDSNVTVTVDGVEWRDDHLYFITMVPPAIHRAQFDAPASVGEWGLY